MPHCLAVRVYAKVNVNAVGARQGGRYFYINCISALECNGPFFPDILSHCHGLCLVVCTQIYK